MKRYDEILDQMQARYRALTGLAPDSASDIGIRLKVLAHEVHGALEELEALRGQVFAQTSTGRYLDMHAETRGIVRKGALHAGGVLRFARESPAGSDIPIGAGVLCATRPDPQVQYETTATVTLPAGALWVEAPARAVTPGALGNAAPGAVCLMVTPAPGISAVVNPEALSGGVDEEDDEALRTRLLRSFQQISNGTNGAFYYDLCMQAEGVASAQVIPRENGRGSVGVVIACHDPAAEASTVAALQEALRARKEINVDVSVRSAHRDPVAVEAEISIAEGHEAQEVLERCRAALQGYLAGIEVGAPLLRAGLGGVLLPLEGVYNYRIVSPAADVRPAQGHLAAAPEVLVRRMEVE